GVGGRGLPSRRRVPPSRGRGRAPNLAAPGARSSWLVVRCYEFLPRSRFRFAHTAPLHIEVPGKPLRPRAAAVEVLIRRVEGQIRRSQDVRPPAALAEYGEALGASGAVKQAAEGER